MPTHLPNLHPAFVHFPIALLMIGVVLDVVAFVFKRRVSLDRSVAFMYLLGTGAAVLTWLSGWLAVLSPKAEDTLDTASERWPSVRFRVAVSAAGTHLKGFLGTRTTVHGHRSPGVDSDFSRLGACAVENSDTESRAGRPPFLRK